MKNFQRLLFGLLVLALLQPAGAQYKDQGGLGGGIGFGGAYGKTDLKSGGDFNARAYLRYSLVHGLQAELGGSLATISGEQYKTHLVPIDARLLIHPLSLQIFNPFVYGGIGLMHYDITTLPPSPTSGSKATGWTGVAPVGLGIQLPMTNQVSFEVSAGYNLTFNKALEAVKASKNDAFWNFLAGLSISSESPNADPDNDGLTNREEKELKTDAHKADTDGDGLTDGEEIHKYHTDPLKVDSDGDGLADGDEIHKYSTDPNKVDSDGDGLADADEILKYHTDPLKADSDGDGLADGDEITKYKTDPLKADSDADGLADGQEINQHHSNPLLADTDGGSVADAVEVARGSNPNDPLDDVPKKEEVKVEVGKSIVLSGVEFMTGKAEITPSSEEILTKAYNTLSQNPEVQVEIRGYTDNLGKRLTNQKLSLARADAVRKYLVSKGIPEARITAKGLGPDNPVASNTTKEGRQKNRRIEFYRTK